MKKLILSILIAIFFFSFGLTDASAKTQINPQTDIDRNGIVDKTDADYFVMMWQNLSKTGWSYIYYAIDFNHDGSVTILDWSTLVANQGTKVTTCHWADTDGNGRVTESDLEPFRTYYGQQINQYSNRYDINNDSFVNILDVSAAGSQMGKKCN